ncbi:MAG: TetR/AcrR family transcriptional regulator [Syntrophomonadaceae bacterium]|nr:TetR/AcrR family transcriptional regulator [Syntrophomonadaceae bacterium]
MEHNKKKILNTALILFARQGFRDTSTAQIAREAGVANGTLFHYFATKDDLIDAVFLFCSINVDKYYRKNVDRTKPLKDNFMQLHKNWLAFALDQPEQYLIINQYLSSTICSKLEKQEIFSEYIERIIMPGIEQGVFRDTSVELILDISCQVLHIVILHFMDNSHLATDPEYVDQTMNFIWDSVRASPDVSQENLKPFLHH